MNKFILNIKTYFYFKILIQYDRQNSYCLFSRFHFIIKYLIIVFLTKSNENLKLGLVGDDKVF